jgi:hypothetical protein
MAIVVLICMENDTAKQQKAPRQSCIQKWTFLSKIGSKNNTAHTWWGGEGFPGATRVLVGVAMVMINFHVELCIESYAFHTGTSLGKRHLPQTGTSMKWVENAVDKTFVKSLT